METGRVGTVGGFQDNGLMSCKYDDTGKYEEDVVTAFEKVEDRPREAALPQTTDENRDATEWLRAHPEAFIKFAGMVVAIHATRGIVASGSNIDAVIAGVARLGLIGMVVYDEFGERGSWSRVR